MNLQDNDFILAIRNYEDIVLSIPMPTNELTIDDIPELYKIFLTISMLIRDYDEDLVTLLHKKWEAYDRDEKIKLLHSLNNNELIDEIGDLSEKILNKI